MLLTVAALLLASAPLDEAKGHLKAGKVDEVFFALDGKTLPDGEKPEASKVLADAGKKALANKDAVMALQLGKMASKLDKTNLAALELSSRASRALEQFTDAETFADQWLKPDPANAEAAVWRAELHIDAGDWSQALKLLDTVKAKGPASGKAKQLRDRAEKELASRQTGLSGLRALERDLARAQAEHRSLGGDTAVASAAPKNEGVILYGTSWCGFCKKAKEYFRKKGVAFTEKDVEKDAGAAKELADKAAAGGVRVTGVPVIDVRGTLVQGFDQSRLERLL
jgi:glutaredoxin